MEEIKLVDIPLSDWEILWYEEDGNTTLYLLISKKMPFIEDEKFGNEEASFCTIYNTRLEEYIYPTTLFPLYTKWEYLEGWKDYKGKQGIKDTFKGKPEPAKVTVMK